MFTIIIPKTIHLFYTRWLLRMGGLWAGLFIIRDRYIYIEREKVRVVRPKWLLKSQSRATNIWLRVVSGCVSMSGDDMIRLCIYMYVWMVLDVFLCMVTYLVASKVVYFVSDMIKEIVGVWGLYGKIWTVMENLSDISGRPAYYRIIRNVCANGIRYILIEICPGELKWI